MKDPGTDLLNKRAITDYVRKLIDSQPGHTVTIAIIDIDDFKTINDTYGHMFGDEVLCKVADILRDAVGSRGLCGRIGGDEMFIIMEGLNDNEGIRNVLRTIRNNTKWLYHDDPRNIKITCSIGSATYPNDAKRYDELFKIADKVLYLAKERVRTDISFTMRIFIGNMYMEWEGLLTLMIKCFTSTIRWRLLIPLSENIRKLMTQEERN